MALRIVTAAAAIGLLGLTGLLLVSSRAESGRHPQPSELREVEVRNDCHRPVWIHYGRTAPLRREDAVTLGPRTSAIQSMIEGDMVWLLDDARDVLDNAKVTATTKRIVVDGSCRRVESNSS